MNNSNNQRPERQPDGFSPQYLGIGVALGVALGLAFGNIALGIAIGVALGAAFGSMRAGPTPDSEEEQP
ncbi:hypothetical protein GCM10023219_05730 [Stakelama sediminis]|uniref:Large-conductance mechanosensitive channel n=1 Tax=Stakelama sediminis TaxID=463200 RepID=A0A840YUP0_9SPHN|nr:hypothetical protein [Stakelama sediminis]MBB5717290.1 large-conductance mechanosensitive channel [Stakelama sediminis]